MMIRFVMITSSPRFKGNEMFEQIPARQGRINIQADMDPSYDLRRPNSKLSSSHDAMKRIARREVNKKHHKTLATPNNCLAFQPLGWRSSRMRGMLRTEVDQQIDQDDPSTSDTKKISMAEQVVMPSGRLPWQSKKVDSNGLKYIARKPVYVTTNIMIAQDVLCASW